MYRAVDVHGESIAGWSPYRHLGVEAEREHVHDGEFLNLPCRLVSEPKLRLQLNQPARVVPARIVAH